MPRTARGRRDRQRVLGSARQHKPANALACSPPPFPCARCRVIGCPSIRGGGRLCISGQRARTATGRFRRDGAGRGEPFWVLLLARRRRPPDRLGTLRWDQAGASERGKGETLAPRNRMEEWRDGPPAQPLLAGRYRECQTLTLSLSLSVVRPKRCEKYSQVARWPRRRSRSSRSGRSPSCVFFPRRRAVFALSLRH